MDGAGYTAYLLLGYLLGVIRRYVLSGQRVSGIEASSGNV